MITNRNYKHSSIRIWPAHLPFIALAGIIFYVVSIILSGKPSIEQVFKDIGIALCIAVLIGYLVDRLLHKTLINEVDHRLKSSSDVQHGAMSSCLEDIFARRGSDEDQDRFEAKINSSIKTQIEKEAGEILISCVAAPQFFRNDCKIGKILFEEFPKSKSICKLRVLLTCPDSEAAKERAELENPHPTISDIQNAATFLYGLKSAVPERIEFKCYDSQAIAFIVVTDNKIFIEPYPLTKLERGEVPLGGRSPMLMFSSESESYRLWKKHFEYLWKKSKDYNMHHPPERSEL